jgi:hypothetical protein
MPIHNPISGPALSPARRNSPDRPVLDRIACGWPRRENCWGRASLAVLAPSPRPPLRTARANPMPGCGRSPPQAVEHGSVREVHRPHEARPGPVLQTPQQRRRKAQKRLAPETSAPRFGSNDRPLQPDLFLDSQKNPLVNLQSGLTTSSCDRAGNGIWMKPSCESTSRHLGHFTSGHRGPMRNGRWLSPCSTSSRPVWTTSCPICMTAAGRERIDVLRRRLQLTPAPISGCLRGTGRGACGRRTCASSQCSLARR